MQLDQLASLWPELVANTVGVLLGGIGALALAYWQLHRQSSEERARNREHLKAVLDWVRLEQSQNQELIEEIRRVFEQDRATQADLLRWAATIAQALTLAAHAELVRGGHHRRLPAEAESQVFRAYQAVSSLKNALRQAEPAVEFYVGCCGEEEAAKRLIGDLEERIETGHVEVARSRKLIEGLDVVESGRVLPGPPPA